MPYNYYPTRYSTGGCADQNELSAPNKPVVEECVAACDTAPACVSFAYAKSGTSCVLSTSCDNFSLTVNQPGDEYMWYERSNGYTIHEQTGGDAYLWLIN